MYFYDFYAGCLHVLCMLNKKDHENTSALLFVVIFASCLIGGTSSLLVHWVTEGGAGGAPARRERLRHGPELPCPGRALGLPTLCGITHVGHLSFHPGAHERESSLAPSPCGQLCKVPSVHWEPGSAESRIPSRLDCRKRVSVVRSPVCGILM